MTTYKVTGRVDELGGVGNGWTVADGLPTPDAAALIIRDHVIPGVRGMGCFSIEGSDGSTWSADFEPGGQIWVSRYSRDGDELGRRPIDATTAHAAKGE